MFLVLRVGMAAAWGAFWPPLLEHGAPVPQGMQCGLNYARFGRGALEVTANVANNIKVKVCQS